MASPHITITRRPYDTLYVQPAYGRRYATQKEVRADWAAGRDFQVHSGSYTSQRDQTYWLEDGYTRVVYEFGNMIVELWNHNIRQ